MENEISPILAPVAALVLWTVILQLRLNTKQLSAMRGEEKALKGLVEGKPPIPEFSLEDRAKWKAYTRGELVEQPTLFYAIAISMALLHGHGDSVTNVVLAWGYVLFRIAHSLVRVTSNPRLYRSILANLESLAVLGLAVHAAIHAF